MSKIVYGPWKKRVEPSGALTIERMLALQDLCEELQDHLDFALTRQAIDIDCTCEDCEEIRANADYFEKRLPRLLEEMKNGCRPVEKCAACAAYFCTCPIEDDDDEM